MTSARRSRIPQRRIAETVASELRTRILSGDDDYRLPTQDQLVKEFGVSYPSIRESLRILETEGLVTVRRGNVGGAEVHRPDESSAAYHLGLALQGSRVTLADLAAALQMLEPLCSAECARRPDRATEVVPVLRANIDACAQVEADGIEFTRTAREFHNLIVAFTPNATVRCVVSSLVTLWSAQEQAWAETLTLRGEYPSRTRAHDATRVHDRLLTAIADGDAAEAERLARKHLRATQALILERYDSGVVNASSDLARQAIAAAPRLRP
ncbi:MAG: FadR family transcriptional regulator [Nocardia sp.]|nr:FadR family transcriptional regulator [Nocardia sp.]